MSIIASAACKLKAPATIMNFTFCAKTGKIIFEELHASKIKYQKKVFIFFSFFENHVDLINHANFISYHNNTHVPGCTYI